MNSLWWQPLLLLGLSLLWSPPAAAAESSTVVGGVGIFWLLAIVGLLIKKPELTRIVAAVGGFGISIYLGIQHGSTEASACNISSTINCDVVNRSSYSELLGIPIAFLGAAFYAVVLSLSFLRRTDTNEQYRLMSHLIFAGSIGAVLYSSILAAISGLIIKAWCLFCIGLYGANLLLLFASFLEAQSNKDISIGTGVAQSLLGKDDKSLGVALGSYLVVLIASVTFLGGGESGPVVDASGNVSLEGFLSQPQNALVLDGSEPVLGPRDARFTIVEFADYECPHCGRVAPEVKAYVEENSDVKMLFKHYPISNACNPNVPHAGHENACDAAKASECALAQGNGLFWKLNRLIFKNQTSLDRSNIDFLAKQVGLDMALYNSCMQQPETLMAVQADISSANEAGLSGTPSFYISGHRDSQGFERIEGGVTEIKAVLDAVRKSKPIPAAKAYAP